MKEVTITEFRTHLHAILRQVHKTGRPVRIARFGRTIAIIRPATATAPGRKLNFMNGKMRILGDIILPASDADDCEAVRER